MISDVVKARPRSPAEQIADEAFMARALELAERGLGWTSPNPMVGAVLVKNGRVIGEGWHEHFGHSHAEVQAVASAKESPVGADLYVTLEPCSHFGKTPPCADMLVKSGIARCFIAHEDPNPLVSGRGIRKLREAGIEVHLGILEERARDLNQAFIKYMTTGLPYVFLKTALSLDGKIASSSGDSKWISNEEARTRAHALRHRFSSVMVGAGTVRNDDPALTCRLPEGGRDPWKIVVDPDLGSLKGSRLAQNPEKLLLVCSDEGPGGEREPPEGLQNSGERRDFARRLEETGARLLRLPGRRFGFGEILKALGGAGIDSVLLEGGSALLSAALRENQVDAGEFIVAPILLGNEGPIPLLGGPGAKTMEEALGLGDVETHRYGDNLSFRFTKKRY